MLLNNYWFHREIKQNKNIQRHMKLKIQHTYLNIRATAEEVLRGKFLAIQANHKRQEKSQTF